METREEQKETETPAGQRANPLLLVLGFLVLGVAFAFLLFGGNLFNREASDPEEEGILSSVPEFSDTVEGEFIVAEIPQGTGGSPRVGDSAPNFPAMDLDGNPVRLAEYAGRPVIVNFWATWCGPCRIEMPALQEAHDLYHEEGVAILAVNRQEDAETVSSFFYDELDLTFTPLLDQEAIAANMYNVFNMPTTFFINAEGLITAVHRGPMTLSQIEAYLAETLPPSG